SSDIIKDFKAVSDMAERFGQQFCANTARGSFPAGSEDIADKTFYLSEEIAESVKEAFQLIEIAYKQALKIYESSHDTKWFACVRSAQRDLVSIMCAMMEYGDGLAARGSMGSSFPATDNLRDNMLFYRTDEHKLYIYKVNKWIELTGGQYLAERNYSFIFDSVKTDDAYLDVGVIRDRHQAYIRWNIYTRDSALPALSDKLGVRIDGAYVRQDTRLGTNQFKWKVALDLDSKALNQVFAQVFSLGVDIYEVTNTDHWDGKHHFWLEVFSDHSDINLFGSVTQIYAPILLFTPTTIMTY
ncbi:MAG: hypothetical protein NTZ48_01220, partial [Candidatus Omnitrophica bacterium]|nr:hypothetical protein [Candidatus Omnitrophota bacterium]